MQEVLFVEYPKCSTCRKAKAWLDAHGVAYVDRDIVTDNQRHAGEAPDRRRSRLCAYRLQRGGLGSSPAISQRCDEC